MRHLHISALTCSLIAATAFAGAFMTPFVSSDFEPKLPKGITSFVDTGISKAGAVLDKVGEWLGEDARRGLEQKGRDLVDSNMGRVLGDVGIDSEGKPITWDRCFMEGADDFKAGWRSCVKAWIAYKAGIPVGIQTITGVIGALFDTGEVPLALLLVLFSICFPLLKVALCSFLSLGAGSEALRTRGYWLLKHTSKWSMTDVFVVALLITFFKAETFNFHFKAEIGVYLFALGAILSSVVVGMLERHVSAAPTSTA